MHGRASRRRFVLGVAALSGAALLAACGQGAAPTAAPAGAQSTGTKPAAVARDLTLYCGKYYGFPMHLSFHVTYYNKKLFQEAGVDLPDVYVEKKRWNMGVSDDGYLEALRKLTRGTGDKRVWGDTRTTDLHVVNYFLFSFGGKLYNEDRTKFVVPDDPNSIKALQYQVDLVLKEKVFPSVEESRSLGDTFLAG